MTFKMTGLVAATFTPMHDDGSLNLGQIEAIVQHLIDSQVAGLYVCGTTGEGPSLSTEEREAVVAAYVAAVQGRIPVIVQVGHTSLAEAARLARHAQSAGAQAISAVAPWYFKPDSLPVLIDCLKEITSAAPQLPFYYYHLPSITGIDLDMCHLLQAADEHLPSLVGIKYTAPRIDQFQACVEFEGGRYDILFGCDEMLLSALAVGAQGAVGSTYNFLTPLYRRLIDAFQANDLDQARRLQSQAVRIIHAIVRFRGVAGLKAAMKIRGVDCGPCRLSLQTVGADELEQLRQELSSLASWAQAARTPR
jgi:N-acetylneuraminate lyase